MGNSTLPLGGGDATRISEIILQPGHGFVAGDVVRADETTPGEYVLAQADTAANAEAVGIVETVAGDSFDVVYQGRVDLSGVAALSLAAAQPTDGWADLVATPFAAEGEVWFLSADDAGDLTRTPPTATGTVIKAMLVVTASTLGAESGILTGYVGVQIGGESLIDLNDIQPVGTILPWAASAASIIPNGWALCNGQAISRSVSGGGTTDDFKDLFDLLFGVTPSLPYGVGDGSTTFNLPNFEGRFPLGQDPGGDADFDDVGETGGEKDHTLTVSELPDHSHDHDTLAVLDGVGAPYTAVVVPPGPPLVPVGSLPGGGAAHNNMPPFLTINFIIRVTAQARAALLDHDLSQHSDVGDVSLPDNCDVLKFDSTPDLPDFPNGKWIAAPTPASGAATTAVFSFRNKFINGQFNVWQRQITFSAFQGYTADRWFVGGTLDGGANTTNVDRRDFLPGEAFDSFAIPGAPSHYADVQNFVAGGSGNTKADFVQRIESVRTFNGQQVTLSFWSKADTAGPHTIAISPLQHFGTGGPFSAPVFATAQEITLTDVWTYYTLTFSIPSVFGKTLGTNNDDSLRFRFTTQVEATDVGIQDYPNPLNFTGTLSLVNVQVELGSTATAFEIREIATELALSQRYYQKAARQPQFTPAGAVGNIGAATVSDLGFGTLGVIGFPVIMRDTPSVVITNIAGGAGGQAAAASDNGIVVSKATNQPHIWSWTADAEL